MDDTTEASEQDERRRRLEGLRALAGSEEQQARHDGGQDAARDHGAGVNRAAPATTMLPTPARRRAPRRFWRGAGAAGLAVLVVAMALLVWVHPAWLGGARAKPIPDPLAIQLDPQFSCPTTVAWSPDGQRVAVLGYRDCPNNTGTAPSDTGSSQTGGTPYDMYGMLYVFDARNGRQLAHLTLDTLVLAAGLPWPANTTPLPQTDVHVAYTNLVWSPDGRRVALLYGAIAYGSSGSLNVFDDFGTGLMLADWAAGTAQVYPTLAALPAANHVFGPVFGPGFGADLGAAPSLAPTSSFEHSTALHWDMRAGSGTVVQVPQAARYVWDANGTLQAAAPLPTSPDTPPGPAGQGAAGNADGGASFTMWQAGWVNYPWHCTTTEINGGSDINCCPVSAYYTASLGVTSAWSPDGRYLVLTPEGTLGALGKIPHALAPSTAPALPGACVDPAQAASLAQLPVRDGALAHVLASLAAPRLNSPTPIVSGAMLAWSPDGKRLAAGYSTIIGRWPPSGLIVYDCASGKALATIAPTVVLAAVPAYMRARGTPVSLAATVWSPDSQRLALLDPGHNVLVLLGEKSLGTGSH